MPRHVYSFEISFEYDFSFQPHFRVNSSDANSLPLELISFRHIHLKEIHGIPNEIGLDFIFFMTGHEKQ